MDLFPFDADASPLICSSPPAVFEESNAEIVDESDAVQSCGIFKILNIIGKVLCL